MTQEQMNKEVAHLRQPVEVYSRVCGYMRPVEAWNDAKQQEFADRVTFKAEV